MITFRTVVVVVVVIFCCLDELRVDSVWHLKLLIVYVDLLPNHLVLFLRCIVLLIYKQAVAVRKALGHLRI